MLDVYGCWGSTCMRMRRSHCRASSECSHLAARHAAFTGCQTEPGAHTQPGTNSKLRTAKMLPRSLLSTM